MTLTPPRPRLALNKAFLKVKPNRNEIEAFKGNLITLLDRTNDHESEEFHKNLVSDFLKDTYYKQNHFINTKGRNDLVIHNGTNAASSVGVIIEAKKPTNKAEMVTPEKLNAKAFHELILYYLRERITHKNLEVKHLIITNINEWYIFDAALFDRLFAQNKKLVQQFQDFEGGRLAGSNTDFFYKEIAQPFVAELTADIVFTYFNIQDYQKPLRNDDRKDDNMLIALFKLLSPEHLLKLPFTNDSNSLDKRFYSELLHIIGLVETKEGGKKLIGRNKEGERNNGSLLEHTILQLESRDKISRLDRPSQYGANHSERLFNVSLELCITWINRILFLKLLEAQLIAYHKGDKTYAFLNKDKIATYDDLDNLFFAVLARKYEERNETVKQKFEKVPYLNSSLFEPTDMEHWTIFISNLSDEKTLPVLSTTVLKNDQGKKQSGNLSTLEYLFEFLNAYDFSSEGSEDIQEDNKTLINASVLGLIFEKINGYKDGSFFTPGFITMYMCRETIRKAVVQKFNESKGWQCEDIGQIYDQIDNSREARTEANDIVNAIKICDPAVGSGHFLVSALNEMISVKNDLRILQDREGQRLKEYSVEVVNDELIITDEEGGLFEYNPRSRESQRIMETLFHEKQRIIENCLFGVDINPNSVKICRLRLWIELLKNAYYKNTTELETLPNIDINIKCGNSLVSRFAIDADLGQALKKSKWTIDSYRLAVDTYRNAESKEQKREMERLITSIKSDFRSEITKDDPKLKRLSKLNGELFNLTSQDSLFEMEKKQKALWTKQIEKLTSEVKKLDAEIEEIKANKIYENAFEWRFEFPEVLNDAGDFVGFDVVIGNPPYIRQEAFAEIKPYLQANFESFTGTADLFVYFIELGIRNLKKGGSFTFIVPNKWMKAGYGKNIRNFLLKQNINSILDFGDLPVFEEATTYPSIIGLQKGNPKNEFKALNIPTLYFPSSLLEYFNSNYSSIDTRELKQEGWTLSNSKTQRLLSKIIKQGSPLADFVEGKTFRGIVTGFNEAFVVNGEKYNELISEHESSSEILKPFLAGRDIKRYQQPSSNNFIIFSKRGIEIEKYPAIYNHLLKYKLQLESKAGGGKWYELQASPAETERYTLKKILYQEIATYSSFTYDTEGYFINNKVFLLNIESLSLLGLLNSKLIWFYLNQIASKLQGGALAMQSPYVLSIPIHKNLIENKELENLTKEVLENRNLSQETSSLENKIDLLVYQLYELTVEEINIVEEKT